MASKVRTYLRTWRHITIPVLLIIVLLCTILVLNTRIAKFIEEQTITRLLEAFDTQVASIENVVDIQFKILTTFSNSIKVKIENLELEVIIAQMNELVETTDFDAAFFITGEGTQISNTSIVQNASSQSYFTSIKKSRNPAYIGTVGTSAEQKIVFSVPIYVDDTIFGVVAATMSKSKLVGFLSSELFGQTLSSCICTSDGTIILGHLGSLIFFDDNPTFNLAQEYYNNGLFKTNGYQTFTTRNTGKLFMTAQSLSSLSNWVLYSSIPYSVVVTTSEKITMASSLALGLVVVVSIVLLLWFYLTDRKQKKILEKDKENLIITEEMYRLVEDLTSSVVFRYSLVTGVFQFNSKSKGTIQTILQEDSIHNMADFRAIGDSLDIKSKLSFQKFCDDLINPAKPNGTIDVLHMEDGNPLWFKLSFNSIFDQANGLIASVGKIEDVTNEIINMDNLQHQAEHDMLTGLLNHSSASVRIEQTIQREDCGLCVLAVLDVDDFKTINDRFGHAMGDDALVVVSNELSKMASGKLDVAGRYGGDEFIVLFTRLENNDDAHAKIATLCERIQTVSTTNNLPVTTTASIGASILHKGMTFQEFFNEADIALYQSKRNGKNCFTFYDQTLTHNEAQSSDLPKRQMASDFSLPLYSLFQRLHASILVLDVTEFPNVKLKYSNQIMYKYIPNSNDATVGRQTLIDTIMPDYRARCLKALEQCVKEKKEICELIQVVGSSSWYAASFSMADKSGQGTQLAIILITNVTPFIQRYQDLEGLLSRLPGAYLMFNFDNKESRINVSGYNSNLLNMFGCKVADMEFYSKTNFIPLFEPGEYNRVISDITSIYREKSSITSVYTTHRIDNPNETLKLQVTSIYLSDNDCILSTFTDVTPLHIANQSLELERQKGAYSLELSGNLIWDIDLRQKTISYRQNGKATSFEDFPKCLIKNSIVHPDCEIELDRLWKNFFLYPNGTFIIKGRLKSPSYQWYKGTYIASEDKSFAIVLLQENEFFLSHQQNEYQRYEILFSHVAVNRLGAFKLNLSKNKVEGSWGFAWTTIYTANSTPTLSQITNRFDQICVNDENKAVIKNKLKIGNLISEYERGNRWLSMPCSIKLSSNEPSIDAELICYLNVEPLTGNLYCLAFLRDNGSLFSSRSQFGRSSFVVDGTHVLNNTSFMAISASALPCSFARSNQYASLSFVNIPSFGKLKKINPKAYSTALSGFAMNLTLLMENSFIFGLYDEETFVFFRVSAHEKEQSRKYAQSTTGAFKEFTSSLLPEENPVYNAGVGLCPAHNGNFQSLLIIAKKAIEEAKAIPTKEDHLVVLEAQD